jgi:hypothetical protein
MIWTIESEGFGMWGSVSPSIYSKSIFFVAKFDF